MKHSDTPKAGRELHLPHASLTRRIAKKIVTCAITGFMAFSPMLDRPARAEVPNATERDRGILTPLGRWVEITEGERRLSVLLVNRRAREIPVLEIDGPARFTVRFYPIENLSRFPEGTDQIPRPVLFSQGEVGGEMADETYPGVIRRSGFNYEGLTGSDLIIGTPITITRRVPRGRHRFSITSPNGFIEVVRQERIQEPQSRPRVPEPRPDPQPQPGQGEEPEPSTPEPAPRRPVASIDAGGIYMREFGSQGNPGDLSDIRGFWNIRLLEDLQLPIGVLLTSHGLSLQAPDAESRVRDFSFNVAAGLQWSPGRHRLYALGFGGYRAVYSFVDATAHEQTQEELSHEGEGGGILGYGYDRWLSASVTVSSNPFVPVSGRLMGALPYGWVDDAYPWAELDLMWLHTMAPLERDGEVGAFRLDENNFYGRLMVGLPVWRFGPFVPSILLGGDLNASEGAVHGGEFYPGLDLALDFERFRVSAAGGVGFINALVNEDRVTPFFVLRAGINQ